MSLKQPLHQPLLIGSLLGIVVSAISAKFGYFVIPSFIYDPIDMIGDSAVPMILMAFGMSLHGTKPLQDKSNVPAVFTVAVLKNIVMPIIAFLLSYFVMGFRGATLYACVVLAALPTGQNVYNYAARYNVGLSFARDGILFLDAVIADFHRNHRGAPRLTSPVLAAVSTTAAARPSMINTVAGITGPMLRMIRGTPSEHHQRITQADSRGQRKLQLNQIEQRRCQNPETATTPSTPTKRPSPCSAG